MAKTDKQEAGGWAEEIAVNYLENQTCNQILFRNWRYKHSEIDIVAQRKNKLVLIEVKYRKTNFFGDPESAVKKNKMRKMQEAAEGFMLQYPKFDEVIFDLICISGPRKDAKLEHFEDAFFPN